jgi:uncharacterized membrane protein
MSIQANIGKYSRVSVLADTRGVVGILFALAMPVLIGFTALGTEVGLWYLERRNLQTAADVGAIAAAFEVLNGTGWTVSEYFMQSVIVWFLASGV